MKTEIPNNFLVSLNATSTFVMFSFATIHRIKRYDMKCSTISGSSRSTTQRIFVRPSSNGTFQNSLNHLQSSQSYECCITLGYETTDILQVLELTDQKCKLTMTNPASESGFTNNWPFILIGAAMLLILLILVVVVGAWVIYCLKGNRR